MNSLMVVQLHSAEIDQFDPNPAIHEWNTSSTKKRRPELNENPLDVAHTIASAPAVEEAIDEDAESKTFDSDFESDYSDYESDFEPDVFDLDAAADSDMD